MWGDTMDILRFINSKDIREHLRNINYEFNSLEAAWLIYQCKTATIEEKHTAWQGLIKTMPDCVILERSNTKQQKSLHEYLKQYIGLQRNLIQEFYTPTSDYVYTLDWLEEDQWLFGRRPFRTVEELQKWFARVCKQERHAYRISKEEIEGNHFVETLFFKNQLYDCCVSYFPNDYEILYDVFNGLWFDFPTPFKKGDILCEYDKEGNERSGYCRGPFVMTAITPMGARERTRMYGDETDMNAWGYFQNEDGTIYHESMWNYMDLEYYRGDLDGKRRILKTLSNHIKGDIDVGLFAKAYHLILCEEHTKDVYPHEHTKESLQLAGLVESSQIDTSEG